MQNRNMKTTDRTIREYDKDLNGFVYKQMVLFANNPSNRNKYFTNLMAKIDELKQPGKQEIELSEVQKLMLKQMITWGEYCYGYWYFDIIIDDMAVLRPKLKREMSGLMKLGLVKCIHGLIDDDGRVCGSGFSIIHEKIEVVNKLLEAK